MLDWLVSRVLIPFINQYSFRGWGLTSWTSVLWLKEAISCQHRGTPTTCERPKGKKQVQLGLLAKAALQKKWWRWALNLQAMKETKRPGDNSSVIWDRQREFGAYKGQGQEQQLRELGDVLGWHRIHNRWSLISARGDLLLDHLFPVTAPLSSRPKLRNSNSIPNHSKC